MKFDFGIKDLPEYLDLINKKLQELTPENIGGLERLLSSSGKRLRPSLVMAVVHFSGREIDDEVINLATAVELVHLASLIHDDIIDASLERRGVPTINASEGVNQAILAGDYLLAKGCALAAGVSAEAGGLLAETVAALSEGQAIELNQRFNARRTPESIKAAAKGKTSSMFIASVKLGGLIAGLNSSQLGVLTDFAENFGLAFQYADDIGDVEADKAEGNYTLAAILSAEEAAAEVENCRQKAFDALAKLDNAELATTLEMLARSF